MDFWNLVFAETCLLIFLEFGPRVITDFFARKICHAGSGALMLLLDPTDWRARYFVYLVVLSSLAMTWNLAPGIKPFRFGSSRDVGITVYLLLVGIWFYLQYAPQVLAPVFFADPGGAVVGKTVDKYAPHWNLQWCGRKTICGSAAVFMLALLSLPGSLPVLPRLTIAAFATLGEAVGGAYDNLLVALVSVGGWLVYA
jgi:hypothetical protein